MKDKHKCYFTNCRNIPNHNISSDLSGKTRFARFCDDHVMQECQVKGCIRNALPRITLIGMAGEEKVIWLCKKHWDEWQ